MMCPKKVNRVKAGVISYKMMQKIMLLILLTFLALAISSSAFAAKGEKTLKLSVLVNPQSQTHLFGTKETKSTDLSAFTKWTSMLKRYQDQMTTVKAATFRGWFSRFAYLKDKPLSVKLRQINNIVNLNRYVPDDRGYGKSDHWATPLEFLEKRYGDCEDFAITKFMALKALGVSESKMRIAVVQDTQKNIAHAVLVVVDQGRSYMLDNQIQDVVDTTRVAHYKPYYSISSNAWWLHKDTGSKTAMLESASQ